MSINLRPLPLGGEVNEKDCGCLPGGREPAVSDPATHPTTTTSPQTLQLWRDGGLLTSLRKIGHARGEDTHAFCGWFIAGRLAHKCHTNLDRSHLMFEEAAEVHNRRPFPQCCRRVSPPRVSGLHSAYPVARQSRWFRKHDTKSARCSKGHKLKLLLAEILFLCRRAKSILNKTTL